MREIYKPYSLKGKKLTKTTTISVALLVAATFILGSASPAFATKVNTTKMNETDIELLGDPTGLDPKFVYNAKPTISNQLTRGPSPIKPLAEEMYGYIAYGGSSGYSEGTCWYTLDDPGTIEFLANTQSYNFIAGGTWTCDERWLGCEYNSGILWEMDPETGDMYSIGGGGTGCHGLAWDPVYNRLYGTSGTTLIEYDPDTGEQEVIGSHGQASKTMIALAINLEGECYAWDVLFSGETILWSIDLTSGEATEVFSFGEPLVYAQDGAFDWDTGTLWLAAYFSQGFLGEVDFAAEELIHHDNFQGGAEITGSAIIAPCIPPEHDVGVKSIDSPQTGPCDDNMPMLVTVKNSGNNTETFNAQMEVIKCEAGPYIMEEYFDGETFPPEGWETDYWYQSNTNNAGGTAPEAAVYRYDQYYDGQYYDNYLMSKQVDCTGLEKVNLKFRFMADLYSTYTASFYVKFRRNSSSNWKDVTPWTNPISSTDPDFYEIGCYGFGEPMGEEFQFLFQYIGYYYYYEYFYLDDITLEACGGCAEYADLIEYITLDPGEEEQISFTPWTPSEWHNESTENTWEEYPLHASVILEGDQQPRNDDKWLLINLWYPWLYDISLSTIDSPHDPGERSLPGQTFPVEATMKNAGQYPMCCIPIDMEIGQPIILDTLLYEYEWPGPVYYQPGYDDGWYDEHKELVYYYGWRQSSTSNSGGDPLEAYLYYYYARADYYFYSAPIDASAYTGLKLEFLSYINHYSQQGLYALEAGYSFDAVTWYAAWHEEPGSSQGYEVSVPIEGGHDTMYIGFWVKGDPYWFNYWYVDNVQLIATGLIEEYADSACQGPDLQPGDYATFTFDDWTPEHLETEQTADIEYLIQAYIFAEGDKNPGNDLLQEELMLNYWHDSGIDAVTSPTSNGKGDVLWDNGDPNGLNGLAGSMYYGYDNRLIDDFHNDETWYAQDGHFRFIWNSGYGPGNIESVKIFFYQETGDCEPSQDEYYEVTAYSFTEWATGDVYFSRPEIAVDCEFDEVELAPGNWWVGFQVDGLTENIAYMLTADNKGCEIMADLPYWGYPRWSSSSYLWGTAYDLAWKLTGESLGPPGISTFMQPGTTACSAIAKNYGTFPERDLTCSCEVREFITDPLYGTQILYAEDGPFDLMTPLGGTKTMNFGQCTFAEEGRYGMYLLLPPNPPPGDYDSVKSNDKVKWGIGVDDTAPKSNATLTPPEPDGLSGWYVNDLEIFLQAMDPTSANVSSGVKEIRYTINSGAEQVIPIVEDSGGGTFVLTQDGNDITIKFWAVDNVGNAESANTIMPLIDMDQTPPEFDAEDFTYEVVGGNQYQGWDFLFTVNSTDAMSDMDRVEFLINDVLQDTVAGTGPTYTWGWRYYGTLHIFVKAIAYDVAGNSIFWVIEDPETTNVPRQHSSNNTPRGRPNPR